MACKVKVSQVKVTITTMDDEVLDTFTVTREYLDIPDNVHLDGWGWAPCLKGAIEVSLRTVEAREESNDI